MQGSAGFINCASACNAIGSVAHVQQVSLRKAPQKDGAPPLKTHTTTCLDPPAPVPPSPSTHACMHSTSPHTMTPVHARACLPAGWTAQSPRQRCWAPCVSACASRPRPRWTCTAACTRCACTYAQKRPPRAAACAAQGKVHGTRGAWLPWRTPLAAWAYQERCSVKRMPSSTWRCFLCVYAALSQT